ncbi:MAG TPA: cytochrome d ubiquinol oxidase subunit II [Gaiellales bacterium]|nr:cytochrome d ubiquinol oxidase subunit II [Gaiellales bacterium]
MTLVAFWFLVLTVLWAGFFLLEGFDLGVGMLHGVVGRDEPGRRAVISTIGPLWDGNEVWLIVAAAGTFAAFPGWYATMFSAFYPVVLLVLAGLILRGVSFEFRSHADTDRGRRVWSTTLVAGSVIVPFGLGIVLGSLLGGVPIDAQQEFTGGLADLLAPYALATGVALTLLCLLHGAAYLALRTAGAALHARARSAARALGPATALAVLGWCIWTRVVSGNGFLLSFIELGAVLAAIAAAVLVRGGREGAAFAATSATMVAVVVSLFTELYPRVMVSSSGAANDLTAQNTASGSYSLTVMTVVVAVLLPVVLLYQGWTYHVFRARLRGPRVGAGEPGPAIPAPRRTPASAGAPRSSDLTEDAGSPAAPAGDGRRGAGGGHSAGALPMLLLATGGLALLMAWLLLRQVLVSRAAPH